MSYVTLRRRPDAANIPNENVTTKMRVRHPMPYYHFTSVQLDPPFSTFKNDTNAHSFLTRTLYQCTSNVSVIYRYRFLSKCTCLVFRLVNHSIVFSIYVP